jgi:hypothetical protein
MRAEQHFREAEKAAAKAAELLGQADNQAAAIWATLAQVHATLALAAVAERDASGRGRPGPLQVTPPGPVPGRPGQVLPGGPLPVTADRSRYAP